MTLPDLGDGHGLIHVFVECVALFASEGVEDLDGAVALTHGDVLVVRIEADAECLLQGVSKGVLVSDLDV